MNSHSSNRIHVALGAIVHDGKVLVAWRGHERHQGGKWEFPGGKVEAGECPQQALQRELYEELGIMGTTGERLIRFPYEYDEVSLLLDTYRVYTHASAVTSHPDCRRRIEWRPIRKLHEEDFPPANRAILNALRLPQFYAITPPGILDDSRLANKRLEAYFRALGKNEIRLTLLRIKGIDADDYQRIARQAVRYADNAGVDLLLHDFPAAVEEVGAAGVHLSQEAFSRYRRTGRPMFPKGWLAVSCHNSQEIRAAEKAGADFCVLAPVKDTPSHGPALGKKRFEEMVWEARIPIYALGGMRRRDVSDLRKSGAQGIAGIRCFDLC